MSMDMIHNVSQESLITDERIDIYFTLEDFRFGMVTFNDRFTHLFTPVRIYHFERNLCPFCGKTSYQKTCSAFTDKGVSGVFQRLIEHPRIRLEWLFMPHV